MPFSFFSGGGVPKDILAHVTDMVDEGCRVCRRVQAEGIQVLSLITRDPRSLTELASAQEREKWAGAVTVRNMHARIQPVVQSESVSQSFCTFPYRGHIDQSARCMMYSFQSHEKGMADFLPVKQQRPLVYINARAFKGTVRLRRYESAETVCSLKQCVGVFTRCCYSWVVGDCEQGASFLGKLT